MGRFAPQMDPSGFNWTPIFILLTACVVSKALLKDQLTFASEREHPRRKHSEVKWTGSPEVLGCAPHHPARSRVPERPLSARLLPTRKHRPGPREQHGRQDKLL